MGELDQLSEKLASMERAACDKLNLLTAKDRNVVLDYIIALQKIAKLLAAH